MLHAKRILLIISGGIAAYKSLSLIRLLKKSGAQVRCILTNGGAQFVTPLSVAAISEEQVYTDLFSLKDETEMGHIRLSREADLVLVAPASANIIAQMAYGLADDLASTTLLATNKPVMICPAMNPMMWQHQATQDNITLLQKRGIHIMPPSKGEMACGEHGMGRLPEPEEILNHVIDFFQLHQPLRGKHALVTSGPTFEPIDPVRYIGNRSSGKQGHAIAQALLDAGAQVTLISGPVNIDPPKEANVIPIETAQEMLEASQKTLCDHKVDIAVCAAAVCDWRIDQKADQKLKKSHKPGVPILTLIENPDILHSISISEQRPDLVIGFAAETENVVDYALQKQARKQCNWIIANNVSQGAVFNDSHNQIYLIKNKDDIQQWDKQSKADIAHALTQHIIEEIIDDK